MARSLDQIISELDTSYNPQRQTVQSQISQLPEQQQAQEAGLTATKDNAFNSILSGARSRNLGFSGIPLGEQAGYLGSTYLPAVANLKSTFAQKGSDLASTLNNIGLDENKYAQTIRQAELSRDETARQFDENKSLEQYKADLTARTSAAGTGAYNLGSQPATTQPPATQVDPLQQLAFNDVYTRVHQQTPAQIKNDYLATLASANYGNTRDKAKIAIYNQLGYKFDTQAPNPVSVNNKPNTQTVKVNSIAPKSLSLSVR